jgi:hypothetical protein
MNFLILASASQFLGWASIIAWIMGIWLFVSGVNYKKCDDWWSGPITMMIGNAIGIVALILTLIWIGTLI